jgi:CheY-like chemotaxis protein
LIFDNNFQNKRSEFFGPVPIALQDRNSKNPHYNLQEERYMDATTHYFTRHEKLGDEGGGDDDRSKEFVSNKGYTQVTNKQKRARFLIAESEKELRYLFEAYLDLLRVDSDIVDNGNRALSSFLQSKKNGKGYDAVILNAHLKGKKGLDVAREIHKKDTFQKIILVTTNTKEQISKAELQSAAIDDKDVLLMPFELSTLSKILTR